MRALILAVFLLGCVPDQDRTPAKIDVGNACERAEEAAKDCEWAKGWAEKCHDKANKGYPRILIVSECMASSTSCAGAAACR